MTSRMSGSGAASRPPAETGFSASAAVAATRGPGPLRHVESTGSTNSDLADEARAGPVGGAVLVADHQTAGRGRLDRTWVDDPGAALLVSLRVPVDGPRRAATVAGWVAASARAAVASLVDVEVATKWPNDLVVEDGPAPGKLAGVLAELVPRERGRPAVVVVGLGINVAPLPRQEGATSVVECGGPRDRDRLLASVLSELADRTDAGVPPWDELVRHSATIGGRVRVELPAGTTLEGVAVRLDGDGALVVRLGDGTERVVTAGDVVHLRPV